LKWSEFEARKGRVQVYVTVLNEEVAHVRRELSAINDL
jgi:hypothetical protein